MNRVLLIISCAQLVLIAGSGTATAAGPSLDSFSVQVVRVATYYPPNTTPTQTDTFSLTCDPPTGTLPLAGRLCQDIAAHPQAMLEPRYLNTGLHCGVSPPVGGPDYFFTITVTANGSTTGIAETSECGDPGNLAYRIFAAATFGDELTVARLEHALRCDETPIVTIFGNLTLMSQWACNAGWWTAANERLIRIAKQAPMIASLNPSRLFPADPGVNNCTIPVGAAVGERSLPGQCGAYVVGNTVTFVEDWSGSDLVFRVRQDGAISFYRAKGTDSARHTWNVVIAKARIASTSQVGALPPQQHR